MAGPYALTTKQWKKVKSLLPKQATNSRYTGKDTSYICKWLFMSDTEWSHGASSFAGKIWTMETNL